MWIPRVRKPEYRIGKRHDVKSDRIIHESANGRILAKIVFETLPLQFALDIVVRRQAANFGYRVDVISRSDALGSWIRHQ